MSEKIYVKDIKFAEVQRAIESALAEVDQGKHDETLSKAGITRPADVTLASDVRVTQPQNLSPETWAEITTIFGSTAAAMVAKDVWKVIVLPKLKKLFRVDRVSDTKPGKSKPPAGKNAEPADKGNKPSGKSAKSPDKGKKPPGKGAKKNTKKR